MILRFLDYLDDRWDLLVGFEWNLCHWRLSYHRVVGHGFILYWLYLGPLILVKSVEQRDTDTTGR